MKKVNVSIITLGCRTNQYESDSIAKKLILNGISVSLNFDKADYYVLNTCSITATADKKSRQLISRVLKLNADAKIFVLGCSSEREKSSFENKPNVIFVGGTQNKLAIADMLISAFEFKKVENEIKTSKSLQTQDGVKTQDGAETQDGAKIQDIHSTDIFGVRAHLKIQDGCNNFCTYCIIPYLRGRSTSRSLTEIVDEAKELSRNYNEIVITGINMSDYKINNELALTKLVNALSVLDCRFRFGSLECNVITPEFISACKTAKNFCPHFHLSMQSGCNKTLKDMNRHYNISDFLDKVNLIKQNFDSPFIACDIIVGFPTETNEDFEETLKTIKACSFSNMHIFPYSSREGTVASKLKQQPPEIIKERERILIELNNSFNENFKQCLIGKSVNVLIEEVDIQNNISSGFSENYVKCYINGPLKINTILNVTLLNLYKDGFICEINL